MKYLKNHWKVIGIIMVAIFIIGVVCLLYFKDRGNKFESVEEFDNKNVVEFEGQNENISTSDEEIYIHIIGEVKNQGVITLYKGQRIIDAIEKAGGVTDAADLSKVNLAYVLSDGQKVRIPSVNDYEISNEEYVTTGGGANVISGGSGNYSRKVNINTATQTELETITGVGPSLAAKIINYREKNGKFKNVEELRNVSGIGDAKFEGLKDFVDV